jgi:hypothetical protein
MAIGAKKEHSFAPRVVYNNYPSTYMNETRRKSPSVAE